MTKPKSPVKEVGWMESFRLFNIISVPGKMQNRKRERVGRNISANSFMAMGSASRYPKVC